MKINKKQTFDYLKKYPWIDANATINKDESIFLKINLGTEMTKKLTNRDLLEKIVVDITELKSDVAILKSDVAILKSDVSELKSDVSELKSEAIKHGWNISIKNY